MRRILSIIFVVLIALSMFAFASCSSANEEQEIPDGFVAVTNANGEKVTDKDGNIQTVTKGTLQQYEKEEYKTIGVPYTNEEGQTYTNSDGYLATYMSRVPVTNVNENTTTHNTTVIGGNDPAVEDIF